MRSLPPRLRSASGSLLVLLLTGGCFGPEVGVITDDPRLSIRSLTVSNGRPAPQETVTLTWSLENESLLRRMRVSVIAPFLFGECAQAQEAGPGPDPAAFTLDDRSITLTFNSACTLELLVEDAQGRADQAAFDLLPAGDTFLRTEILARTSDDYPDTAGPRKRIEFQQFVAFFDPPNRENGVIDALPEALLPRAEPFRAYSTLFSEALGFGPTAGRGYVGDCADLTAPLANAYVFGQTLLYTGGEFPVEDEKQGGRLPGRHGSIKYTSVFLALPLRVTFGGKGVLLYDVAFGNVAQGFVVSLACGFTETGLQTLDPGPGVTFTGDGFSTGSIQGRIAEALPGQLADLRDGLHRDLYVQLANIEFAMPFERDEQLGSRLHLTGCQAP